MSELMSPPILTHPEVTEAEEKLLEPREAERLAYEYKVGTEEMHVIADEIGQYVTYDSLAESSICSSFQKDENLYQRIIDVIQNKDGEERSWSESRTDSLRDRLKEEYLNALPEDQREEGDAVFDSHFIRAKIETLQDRDKLQITLEDLVQLWKEDPKAVVKDLVFKGIRRHEQKMVGNDSDQADNTKVQDTIKAQTLGRSAKIAFLLKSHFQLLLNKLSSFSEEQLTQIQAYGLASKDDVRRALTEIHKLEKGILSANVSKSPEVVRKPDEIANIYGVETTEIDEVSDWLSEAYEEEFGEKVELGVERIYDAHIDAVDKDFVTSYVNYRQELSSLFNLLNKGKIVETEYVREIIERALPSLEKNPPTIVYLHGDFGTGKTALATHIAKTRFGKEPIIVSGSKFLDPDRFTEEFRIQKLPVNEFLTKIYKDMGVDKEVGEDTRFADLATELVASQGELTEQIRANLLDEYRKNGRDIDELDPEIQKRVDDQVSTFYSNQVQGRYIMGAMYQAMSEGRPLIMDEANAISPDVLIAFNDLLTRKFGSNIATRTEKGDITVKPGYCVIWTGNTGDRYKSSRFNDVDPATYSRINPIEVRYLPNSNAYNSIESDVARLDLQKIDEVTFEGTDVEEFVKTYRKDAINDQIFQVLATKLLNRRLGAELLVKTDDRYSVFKDLYRLGVGARMIMDLFEGNIDPATFPDLNLAGIVGSNEAATLKQTLKKANLSMRELMDNIVGGYLDGGCNMDIEYYLWNFVKKYDSHPEEQAILYAVLKQAQFFRGEGWSEYSDIQGDNAIGQFKERMSFNPIDTVPKYKKVRKNGEFTTLLDTNGEYSLQYFSSLETMQIVFGYLPPRKKEEYEKIGQKLNEAKSINLDKEEKMRLVRGIAEVARKVANIENYESSTDCKEVIDQMRALPICKKEQRDTMDDAGFLMGVNEFYDMLINFASGHGMIDKEAADAALGGSIDDKNKLVNDIWK